MGHINWKRVILGGLLCGLVINASEFMVNGIFLEDQWADAFRALGRTAAAGPAQMAAFVICNLLVGIFAVWLYAEIQPHYGRKPLTAVIAGLAVWFLGYFLAMFPVITNLFPAGLMLIALAVGLAETLAGTLAGAWFYQHVAEHGTSSAAAKA